MLDNPEDYVFFFHAENPFSHWHPSDICVEFGRYNGNAAILSVKFKNAEQCMMWHKARTMKDSATAAKILSETDPKKVKALGREIKGFNQELWDAVKYYTVLRVNYLKFSQNPSLLKQLLDTDEKFLAEASPYDKIWGIGLDEENAKLIAYRNWPGQNILGHVLMEVRQTLRDSRNFV